MNYKPPYTITSKILVLVSDIVERLADIKNIESKINTVTKNVTFCDFIDI
jgi:hypothetical protein